MRAIVQRVSSASVTIDGRIVGNIGDGLVILLGITHNDTEKEVAFLSEKCANLRIFNDENDKMNLSLLDIGGEALIVSQFTLYGSCRKGRRPNFTEAAKPDHAIPLYEKFISSLRRLGIKVATGEFGAMMMVEIHNDGPVTLMVETPN